ncbi:hypothetical protein BVY03_06145 [bacterium K02(2017)]|nr:hypothetical protein BVY03_06145 [bacterium K02(2017)]
MKKNFLIFVFIELIFLSLVLMITKADLFFNTSDTIPITDSLITKSYNLTYDQEYQIDHPMKFLLNIISLDETAKATLIWPTAPYGRFLVLATGDPEELKEHQIFKGRLVRCLYKCVANDMVIDMFGIVEQLENKYPKLKGKYSQLPSILIDTTVKPKGLDGYFYITRYYWIGLGIIFALGLGLLVKKIFF